MSIVVYANHDNDLEFKFTHLEDAVSGGSNVFHGVAGVHSTFAAGQTDESGNISAGDIARFQFLHHFTLPEHLCLHKSADQENDHQDG